MSRLAEALTWERSRVADPANLVMLVTIANCANDEGRDAWPEVKYLMEKCRMKERRTQYVLRRLVASGEIEIEMNDEGREITLRGGRKFRPKWFIHVLCVAEWERYQGGWKPADIALFRRGRPLRKSADVANLLSEVIRKKQQGNPQDRARKTANDDGAYKEGSKKELVVEQEQGEGQAAAPPIRTHAHEDPNDNLSVITVLAHELYDALGLPRPEEAGEYMDQLKQRCADEGVAYDSGVVRKALDSALWQRRRKRGAQ